MEYTVSIHKKLFVRNILILIGKTIRMFIVSPLLSKPDNLIYGAQNEAYMSRSAEKWVRGLCFNELGVGG